MADYIVSVYCTAYNHEKYIRKTLEGFVNQKTDFPVKFIVHDDASTDKTADIIREYAAKYPDKIFPVLQKENKYSKKIPIIKTHIVPRLEGKYVAICEGDDYWCDENKLQLQYDFLEANPDYSMCLHNTVVMNEDGSLQDVRFNNSGCDRDYSTSEIIQNGPSHTAHTSSFMFRKEYADLPSEYLLGGTGDFSRMLYCSLNGKVRYIDKVMSYYRWSSEGNWTSRIRNDRKKHIEHCQKCISDLKRINELTNGEYNDELNSLISHYSYLIKVDKKPWLYDNKTLKSLMSDSFKQKMKKTILKR